MINRNYLPFESARAYHDRGMSKWMGFFLSEHTTALVESHQTINLSNEMAFSEKLLLFRQLYSFQLLGHYTYQQNSQLLDFKGTVSELMKDSVIIKGDHYLKITINDIIKIELGE